jgi:hypothetical protein
LKSGFEPNLAPYLGILKSQQVLALKDILQNKIITPKSIFVHSFCGWIFTGKTVQIFQFLGQ